MVKAHASLTTRKTVCQPANETIWTMRTVRREKERTRRTLIESTTKARRSRSTDEREIRLRATTTDETTGHHRYRRRTEVGGTVREILVEFRWFHRIIDEENTFETIVVNTFAQPTSTGKSSRHGEKESLLIEIGVNETDR